MIYLGYRVIRIRKRGKKTCKNESALYCTMECGDLIKERRAVLGLTQQDLSDYTGFGVRVIKSIEVEKGSPSLNMLEKIANS